MEKPETLIATVSTSEKAELIRKRIINNVPYIWLLVKRDNTSETRRIFACTEFFGKISQKKHEQITNLISDLVEDVNELDESEYQLIDEGSSGGEASNSLAP